MRRNLSSCFAGIILLIAIQSAFSADLNVSVCNMQDGSTASALNFGVISATETEKISQQYLKVYFESSSGAWRLDIHTDNKDANCGYEKGGLLNIVTNIARMPLKWASFKSTQSISVLKSFLDWCYLKDKNDEDNPSTSADESWNASFSAGYTNVAYGGAEYCNLNDGTSCSSPISVYIKSLLDAVPTGNYSGTIYFDLYTIDDYPPYICHTPLDKIGLVGDDLVFNAKVLDDIGVKEVQFHYRIDSSSWNIGNMTSAGNSTYTYRINSEVVASCSEISYCISAKDSSKTIYWNNKDESSPQKIEISKTTEWHGVKEGTLSVEDGNPETGDLTIFIPTGALTESTNITFEQEDVNDSDVPNGNSPALSLRPLAVFKFGPDGLKFQKPVVLTLRFFEDGQNLAPFFYDGFEWRRMGCEIDTTLKTITTKTEHFSLFAIFPSKELSEDDLRPAERIITPATFDGFNDFASFEGLYNDFVIKIFDINGKIVREIKDEKKWDGTDENGNIVESGVYIYQVKTPIDGKKKVISGVIAVAK